MTSVKHFAAYGAVEGGKEYNTVDMSPQRLFNDYMPPYKAGLDAGSGAVMVALNSLNGTPATSDSWLLKTSCATSGALKASPFPTTAPSKS